MPSVDVVSWNGLASATTTACAELWELVWPGDSGSDPTARSARMRARFDPLTAHHFHLAQDGGQLVAVARTFHHTVGMGDQDLAIIALASVCSDPARRGQGWGDAVVRSAFSESAEAGRPCLFQTGVSGFYERFGARTISNRVFTSHPGAKAFDDAHVMIHPGEISWDDEAAIDLRMAGW